MAWIVESEKALSGASSAHYVSEAAAMGWALGNHFYVNSIYFAFNLGCR